MTAAVERVEQIPHGLLHPSPTNPRKRFAGLEELAASIRTAGIVQPITVRPWPAKGRGHHEIVCGERRWRAAKLADLAQVPCLVRELGDAEVVEIQAIENLQREDIHPLEEADEFERLIRLWRTRADKPARGAIGRDEVERLAGRVGRSLSYVYQRLKLRDLDKPGREAFLEGRLTAGHAILLARLQPKDQAEALRATFAERWDPMRGGHTRDAIGVRSLAAWIQSNLHLSLAHVRWPLDDATLLPKAGACSTCPKMTSSAPELFEDARRNTCTDRVCFAAKLAAWIERAKAEGKAAGREVVELSTDHQGARPPGRVLTSNRWQPAGAQRCEATRQGILVDGPERGGSKLVCTAPLDCPVHSSRPAARAPERSGRERRAAQVRALKERRAAEIRRRVYGEILEGVAGAPRGEALRGVCRRLVVELWSESLRAMVKALGWEADKGHPQQVIERRIARAGERELWRVLVGLSLARDLPRTGSWAGTDTLMAAAKAAKVNVAAIARDVAKAMPAPAP